jgi:hypothetical protein
MFFNILSNFEEVKIEKISSTRVFFWSEVCLHIVNSTVVGYFVLVLELVDKSVPYNNNNWLFDN